jgi:DNA-binding beta-propeller fold protein YncE
MRKVFSKILLVVLTVSLFNCVEKFNAPDNSPKDGDSNIGDTLYVKLSPDWTGFNRPQDIIIGKETFIYVADTDNDRIVVMNLAGHKMGERSIKKPVAIAQDFQLNLIVCARFDTLINGNNTTYSAVFKLDMVAAQHHIENAPITRILPKTSFDFQRPDREFTGVATFFDNGFLIARRGPGNATLIDPDNSILLFRKKELSNGNKVDTLIGRVPLLSPLGTGLMSANNISSLTSFNGNKYDIIITLTGENSFKTQVLQYITTEDFTGYQNKIPPFVTDLMTVAKFEQPEGTAMDIYNNIFVADAAKDSIFKFNSFGDEMESFGGPEIFNSPHAVAYFNKTLYVADTDNNRILRFVLSTDID